tara:strand:+ start:464 stop:685 length:222 start_codon:yes stop_codon:yes gene_type:complete
MRKIKVILEVDDVIYSKESTEVQHEQNLKDIFSEEYKQLTKQDQLLWCLESIEDTIKNEIKTLKTILKEKLNV